MEWKIRPIQPGDNPELALIIRTALTEFGANKPGTVYYDESTDHLFELFQTPGSCYFIAEENNQLLGGAGLFPTPGLPEGWGELVKMYLRKEARGLGLGRKLIAHCLEEAKRSGYHTVYLETMPELRKAVAVYEQFGFEYLGGPVGNSGHFGCDVWMKKTL
ncbi:GNAT family N-acetyltransferase [Flavihumibacter cheonanensis]|uniref:GNAT family N-acetyltransferase n=1 Tax=Flavihumibacter cheonanensis TaxID=1442385 RepID=UPI001EF86F15|nr:GNAT family N-acetyltransferase [Flavihumibacter cheonanensis]MCG7752069.1 GNAT family N-acetyltransferase [Flavihumibacter cheonanensis]